MDSPRDRRLNNAVQIALIALAAIAVVQELRKPKGHRDWHGRIGPVPYDLRRPTLDRVRSRLWSPDAALFQPHPMGVGWTVNLGRLVRLVTGLRRT